MRYKCYLIFLANDIYSKIYNCIRYSLKSCSIYKQFDNVKKYSYNTFSKFYFSLFYTPMIKLIQKYYLIIKRLFNNPTNFDVSKTSSVFLLFLFHFYIFLVTGCWSGQCQHPNIFWPSRHPYPYPKESPFQYAVCWSIHCPSVHFINPVSLDLYLKQIFEMLTKILLNIQYNFNLKLI